MRLAPFDVKNDNYHLGHLVMDGLRSRPNAVCQIDASTGKSETNASVLSRSIQLARCLRKFGAKPGTRLALGGNNHLDLHIPFYAAHFNGMPLTGVDPHYKLDKLKVLFKICEPGVAFCEKDMFDTYVQAAEEAGVDVKIIHYGEGENSLGKFIEEYDDGQGNEEFLPAIFDLDKVYAWMTSTGGTTGVVKLAAFKHKALLRRVMILKSMQEKGQQDPPDAPNKNALHVSPVQWVSAFFNAITFPLSRQTKVQSSAEGSTEHYIDIINQYKPVTAVISPYSVADILKNKKPCDFTCFDVLVVSGGKVRKELILELREKMRPNALALEVYAQTEQLGPVLRVDPRGPIGSCGKESPLLCEVKLVDPVTNKVITEPNVPGEIWIKGAVFSEYYNNPEETAKAFSEDGWFKSGDILYKDEEGYFYFVERARMRIKFQNHEVIPSEVEDVILQHPGVYDVSVTSIPHAADGEHIVACVVKRPGADVTAAEIKDLVASTPAIFDLDKVYAWMTSTGGTTGVVKLAAFKHKALLRRVMILKSMQEKGQQDPPDAPNKNALHVSPVQWVSAFFNAITFPLSRQTKVQSSAEGSTEHYIDIINQYKPVTAVISPYSVADILKNKKPCDFTCFDVLVVSGGKVRKELILELREKMRPNALALEVYAQTEQLGPVLRVDPRGPIGSCGKESPLLCEVKLVDPVTNKVITEPNVPGEIWIKGAVFSEYYNNPEETAKAFSEDGWFKSGDILYKDEEGYFYFVERARMRIKFQNHEVIPSEVEDVILQHPGVYDVSVTSIPHAADGEHIVACVVKRPGADVTAAEIKDLVASKLPDSYRLRGGVVFLDKIPLTSSLKVARGYLSELVLTVNRE